MLYFAKMKQRFFLTICLLMCSLGGFAQQKSYDFEFYVDDNNVPKSRIIYQKVMGHTMMCKPSAHLVEYLLNQNIDVSDIIKDLPDDLPIVDGHVDLEKFKEKVKDEITILNNSL